MTMVVIIRHDLQSNNVQFIVDFVRIMKAPIGQPLHRQRHGKAGQRSDGFKTPLSMLPM